MRGSLGMGVGVSGGSGMGGGWIGAEGCVFDVGLSLLIEGESFLVERKFGR